MRFKAFRCPHCGEIFPYTYQGRQDATRHIGQCQSSYESNPCYESNPTRYFRVKPDAEAFAEQQSAMQREITGPYLINHPLHGKMWAVEWRVPRYEDNPRQELPSGLSQEQLDVAVRAYENFHDFAPKKIEKFDIPRPKTLVKIGDWTRAGYFSDKWKHKRKFTQKYRGKKGQQYSHDFEDEEERPLVFAPDEDDPERGFLIGMGRVRLTKHGITDLK